MTLISTTVRQTFNGNGATTGFTIPADFWQNADILVYIRDEADPSNITETLQTEGALQDYTLTGGDPASGINPTTVTFNTAPTATDKVVLVRSINLEQELDLATSKKWVANSVEEQLDKIVGMIQQLNDKIRRSVIQRITTQSLDLELSEPEANKLLSWNSTATKIVNIAQSAGLTAGTYRAGSANIAITDTSLTVVFSTPMSSTNYRPVCSFFNDTDGGVDFQPYTVTQKTLTGFTVKWNSPFASANYKLHYLAMDDA